MRPALSLRTLLALGMFAPGLTLAVLANWSHRPAVLVAAVAGGWAAGWIVGLRELRAVRDATRAVERLGDGELSVSLPEIGSAEVRALARAINHVGATASRREDQLNAALDDAATQRDLFSSIINASSDGLLLYDTDRLLVAANVRCGELLGFSVQELLHTPSEVLRANLEERTAAPAIYQDQLERHFQKADQPYQDTLVIEEPRRRVLRRYSCPVINHRGVQGRVFTYTDVTAESDLDQMKSEFVSTASHELRTPLTSVHAALQLALTGSGDRLADEDRELLEISLANTERLVRLVNDLLDLSKLEAGRMPFDVSTMRVGALLDEAARGVHVLATTREARIVTNLGDGVESMVADHDQILRVLTNLLSNALKYSPTGSLVHLSARDLGDAVEVAVEDEGPGIPPEQVDRLFRPFSRLGMQERQTSGGTGLGLAISRAIIEQHGGRIWWERRPPRGSRFVFVVPQPDARRSAVTAVGDRAVA
jgi:signal transduction histidine kinase